MEDKQVTWGRGLREVPPSKRTCCACTLHARNVPCSHKGNFPPHFSWNLKPLWPKWCIPTFVSSIGTEKYFSITKKIYCKPTNNEAEWWKCPWPGRHGTSLGDRSYSVPAHAHHEKWSKFQDLISIMWKLPIFKCSSSFETTLILIICFLWPRKTRRLSIHNFWCMKSSDDHSAEAWIWS